MPGRLDQFQPAEDELFEPGEIEDEEPTAAREDAADDVGLPAPRDSDREAYRQKRKCEQRGHPPDAHTDIRYFGRQTFTRGIPALPSNKRCGHCEGRHFGIFTFEHIKHAYVKLKLYIIVCSDRYRCGGYAFCVCQNRDTVGPTSGLED